MSKLKIIFLSENIFAENSKKCLAMGHILGMGGKRKQRYL